MTPVELAARFGRKDRLRMAALLQRARAIAGGDGIPAEPLVRDSSGEDFARARSGYCRVIEIWTLDSAVAPSGVDISMGWHCRWMLPDGTLLDQYHSPFGHGSHPFAVKFYPLTDGEVHSFVEDVIDQQKFVNRMITIIDHVMDSTAKGVLIYPTESLPEGFSWQDLVSTWRSPNGVIPYDSMRLDSGFKPEQLIVNGANTGAYELLNLQMSLFEKISGVSAAMQGQNLSGVNGSKLYDSQVENSTISLLDLFDSFTSFLAARNNLVRSLSDGGRRS